MRLDPEPDTPRSVTPCVVGFATREEERRNSVKPGVDRSASSSAPAAMLLNSAEVSTVELAALGSRSAPRVAVTTTESAKLTGRSTICTGRAPSISTVDGFESFRRHADARRDHAGVEVAVAIGLDGAGAAVTRR